MKLVYLWTPHLVTIYRRLRIKENSYLRYAHEVGCLPKGIMNTVLIFMLKYISICKILSAPSDKVFM